MPECDVCGEDNFVVEDGLYYCMECNTQSQILREEEADDEMVSSRRSVAFSKQKKQSLDIIEPWLTIEAFNVIVKEQVNKFIEIGGSPLLYQTVLQLWAKYIQTCEIAFMEDNHWIPKHSIAPRNRDIDVLSGNRLVGRRLTRHRTKSQVLGGRRMTLKEYNSFKADKSFDLPLCSISRAIPKSINKDQASSSQRIYCLNDSPEKKIKRDRKKRDPIVGVLPKRLPITVYPKEIKLFSKIARKKMKRRKTKSVETKSRAFAVDSMCLCQTVCFSYAAILLLGETILLSDIIRWIQEDRIPYIHAWSILPPEMIFQKEDLETYSTSQVPQRRSLERETKKIFRFLKISEVPSIPYQPVLLRILLELNLPLVFQSMIAKLLAESPNLISAIEEPKATIDVPSSIEIEAASLCVILMKILFVFDGEQEKILSEKASLKNVENGNHDFFVLEQWTEWTEHHLNILEAVNLRNSNTETTDWKSSCPVSLDFFYRYFKQVNPKPKETRTFLREFLDLKANNILRLHHTNLSLQNMLKRLGKNMREICTWPTSFPFSAANGKEFSSSETDSVNKQDYSRCQILAAQQDEPYWLLEIKHFSLESSNKYFHNLPHMLQILCKSIFVAFHCDAWDLFRIVNRFENILFDGKVQ